MEGSSTLIDKESSGTWFKTDSKSVLIGRYHNHDENGYTTYYTGTIVVLPDGDITERTARGYTGMVKVETSVVGRWPEGDRYVAGRKIADVYQLTYDIPVSSDRFLQQNLLTVVMCLILFDNQVLFGLPKEIIGTIQKLQIR